MTCSVKNVMWQIRKHSVIYYLMATDMSAVITVPKMQRCFCFGIREQMASGTAHGNITIPDVKKVSRRPMQNTQMIWKAGCLGQISML